MLMYKHQNTIELGTVLMHLTFNFLFMFSSFFLSAEPPAFEVLPSLKRLKQRISAAGRGEYDAVFMSGR